MKLFENALVEHITWDGTNYLLAAGTSDVNSGAIDLNGCHEVSLLLLPGVMAASSSCDWKLQESADNSSWADITGTALAQVTATDDDKMLGITIRNPLKRYLRVVSTRGEGGNSTLNALISIKWPRKKPVTQAVTAGQFIAAPEIHVSPIAGTA